MEENNFKDIEEAITAFQSYCSIKKLSFNLHDKDELDAYDYVDKALTPKNKEDAVHYAEKVLELYPNMLEARQIIAFNKAKYQFELQEKFFLAYFENFFL